MIVVDEDRYNEIAKYGFPKSLGYWFWNMAVMIAPYDTGNLRRSITLGRNTQRHINILYNLSQANYIRFLEEGIGPVKKYKNFIKGDTAGSITEQLVGWIKSGQEPMFSVSAPKPFVQLRDSRNVPFSQERSFLRQANMNTLNITAKTRMEISKIRQLSFEGKVQRSKGERVETGNNMSRSSHRNISQLQNIYRDRKKQVSNRELS